MRYKATGPGDAVSLDEKDGEGETRWWPDMAGDLMSRVGRFHVTAGLRTLSRELDWEVACRRVTASRSGLHCTTASHFPRPLFFFFRLKKQQHLKESRRG